MPGLYGRRWAKRRAAFLAESPWCAMCGALATEADHITPHGGDPDQFWTGALQALCKSCHSRKTRLIDQGHATQMRVKGCDVNGLPLDPAHPWHQTDANIARRRASGERRAPPERLSSIVERSQA